MFQISIQLKGSGREDTAGLGIIYHRSPLYPNTCAVAPYAYCQLFLAFAAFRDRRIVHQSLIKGVHLFIVALHMLVYLM